MNEGLPRHLHDRRRTWDEDVVSSTDCVLNGTNVTVVSMGCLGLMSSGEAMLVYDAEGKLIDWTGDEGENGRFQRKWSKVGTVEIHE